MTLTSNGINRLSHSTCQALATYDQANHTHAKF